MELTAAVEESRFPCSVRLGVTTRPSHGLAAADYGPLLQLVESGRIRPQAMVRRVLPLDAAAEELPRMDQFPRVGITVFRV